MLSGIGPADQLRDVGVEPRHDLRGVGESLQDHPFVTVLFEVRDARHALRRRQAEAAGRVAAAPQRPADLHGRRGRARSCAPGRGCRPPTSSSTSARSSSRTTGRPSSTATPPPRARAGQHAQPRAGLAALLRPARQAAHPHQHAGRADDVDSLVAGVKLAREMAASGPMAGTVMRELRARGRRLDRRGHGGQRAPAGGAALPPGRAPVPWATGESCGARPRAARPRPGGPARGGRVRDAVRSRAATPTRPRSWWPSARPT